MRLCHRFDRAIVLVLTAVVVGCGSSPTAPSVPPGTNASGPIAGGSQVFATADDPGLPQNTVTLKATTPGLVTPADGAELSDPAVELTTSSPSAIYGVPWEFSVRFEIYASSNPGSPVYSEVELQGSATLSHTVPSSVLQDETSYVWRARAESEGAVGPWSDIYGFTTAFTTTLGPPVPLSPVGDVTVTSLRPSLTVKNGDVTSDVGTVTVVIEISLDESFTSVAESLQAHTRDRGETNLFLRERDLLAETRYFWRARSTNKTLPDLNGISATSGLPVQTVITVTSEWSETATFQTPTVASIPSDPSDPSDCCPPPNRLSVVRQVADETGYPSSGISVHDFTQRVAERLASEDSNWGRYLNSRGNLGKDTVAYRVDGQNNNPYKIDIVLGASKSNPQPHWSAHGLGDGTWKSVN